MNPGFQILYKESIFKLRPSINLKHKDNRIILTVKIVSPKNFSFGFNISVACRTWAHVHINKEDVTE